MCLLSIILPVYNGEERIGKCIESILHQKEINIQLIIIDDGSTDASRERIQEVIDSNDNNNVNAQYIYQKNHGVAYARNMGIDMASGEYITFVDQDDYLAEDYCQRMLEVIVQEQTDIVVGGYVRVDGEGHELYRKKLCDNGWAPYIVTAPWSHIYRTTFLKDNQIQFLRTGIGEDVYFNMIAYANTNDIGVVPYEGYFWMNNPKSVSNTRQISISKKSDPFPLLKRLEKDMPRNNGKKREYEEYFMLRYIVWYILYTLRGSEWKDVKDMQKRLFIWLSESYPQYYKNPNISLSKPKGDTLVNRWSVWVVIRAKRLGVVQPLLRVLSLF